MMAFITTVSEHFSWKHVGIGLTIFVSGGLVSYSIFQYWNISRPAPRKSNKELTGEINDLKNEIIVLKGSLSEAVTDFRKELDGIRGAVEKRHVHGNRSYRSSQSVKTIGTYQTAWSDDDFPSDNEYELPPDHIGVAPSPLPVDDIDAICAKVDKLNEGSDEDQEEAMRILQDNELNHQDSFELMWRLSRSHIGAYSSRDAYDERCLHATSALDYARNALRLKEDSSEVHKWYAISLGATTDFVGTKEKIECGYELKEHIDRAIELDENDPTLHFMKGRWCWGVYMLTWIERKLAATLFATPPSATIDDALNSFTAAEEIQPGFYKANQFYLAKCYYEMSDYATAKKWLQSAVKLPSNNKDDRDTQKEINQLMMKL